VSDATPRAICREDLQIFRAKVAAYRKLQELAGIRSFRFGDYIKFEALSDAIDTFLSAREEEFVNAAWEVERRRRATEVQGGK
jgi:hypothetical protein